LKNIFWTPDHIIKYHPSIYLWLYGRLSDLGHVFSFLILYKVGLLGWGTSLLQGRYLHTEQHKHRINAHRHQFEPTVPAFEWAKTVHALDHRATVIGIKYHSHPYNITVLTIINNVCWDVTLCRPFSTTAYLESLWLLGSTEGPCSVELRRRVCVRCVSSFQSLSDYAKMDRAPSVSQISFVLNIPLGTLVFVYCVQNKGFVEWIWTNIYFTKEVKFKRAQNMFLGRKTLYIKN
jgi:hypothetical protein